MTSSPVFIVPNPVLATGRALRILLIAGAILALATVAFVLGRVSVGSSSIPARAPSVITQLSTANDTSTCQQIAHYRLMAC
jgi:hypothetical protein